MKDRILSALVLVAVACCTAAFVNTPPKTKKVVIAYVGGFRGLVNADSIDVRKLTHINYAFVNVKDNAAWLENEATDTVNFRKLNLLKRINPDLKILISIGGWSWSDKFSDAVLTEASRKKFAQTSVAIIKKYKLDGVDIDWEYPAMPGEEGNVYRPEDKQNYTLMFKAIREELNVLEKQTKKKYLLTTAVGGYHEYIDHTEMDKAQVYLDYVNIMSYDFKTGADSITGHHTNLYASNDYATERSTDRAITEFIAAGVPASKIVMGVAFYARSWTTSTPDNRGMNQRAVQAQWGGGYSKLKETTIDKNGFKRYWDERAKAPYLFNEEKKIFISYDDEMSITEKCHYVTAHNLGGVMFWEYSEDPKGYLLGTISRELK
jgi:chitinase